MEEKIEDSIKAKKEKNKKAHKILLHLHVVLLCLLIATVWAALSLPVVFFNRPPEVRSEVWDYFNSFKVILFLRRTCNGTPFTFADRA